MQNFVILVDELDNEIGISEKLEAHIKGLLHRAFSIVLFNSKGEMLLQQRTLSKYHSAGLWSNSCCSHPQPNETIVEAAKRRMKEELYIDEVSLQVIFSFNYKIEFGNGLFEHEIDHVLIGYYDETPALNPRESMNYCWKSFDEIKRELKDNPELYSYWFKHIIDNFEHELKNGMYENLQERNV